MNPNLVAALIGATAIGLAGTSSSAATEPATTAQALHVLNRIAYGPRPGDLERVRRMGIDAYIAEQLAPERIAMPASLTRRLAALDNDERPQAELISHWRQIALAAVRDTSGRGPGSPVATRNAYYRAVTIRFGELRLFRAIESPRQLQEVMVNFWFNHFNVVNNKRVTRVLIGDYERKAIRPHALGRFRDMLGAVAKHPAMLAYLDNWVSAAPGLTVRVPGTRRRVSGLNENFARELMELHTIGVDGGYTQHDVRALARMLTGWTYSPRDGDPNDTFTFATHMHDDGDKVWLGKPVRASGRAEGEWALDVLAAHPATARHVSYKLAQYFVADDPPPALVQRMARRFLETDGDIRAVMTLLLASSEFRSPGRFGVKFKTPYEYVISAVRASGGELNNVRPLLSATYRMGMPLYGCGSPDGYKNTEATWLNADALAQRISFATGLALGRLRLAAPPGDAGPDLGGTYASATMAAAPADEPRLDPPASAAALRATLGASAPLPATLASAERARPGLAAALILGGPTFMRR
ncbi:MAG: DUF1800 domain-containing protein [Burkholderiaceae bacterium]|nr:DUF1800 domain-containing protein [Burkholderiaceae bacterium]